MIWPGDFINRMIQGDALTVLRLIPDEVIQTCVTSPPYWGLRDYGIDGQLGLEKTPEEYVEKMVAVFHEARRALRGDGTLWLNLGDSYARPPEKGEKFRGKSKEYLSHNHDCLRGPAVPSGLKPKDLIGIPWRVAFALQQDGWYLRSDIIWAKPNPMPESVKDRPTKAHEYIFLMSKNQRYYYDADAILDPCESGPSDVKKMIESKERIGGRYKLLDDPLSKANKHTNIGQKRAVGSPNGRNKRSVWAVPTQPFPDAHFAVFPPKLIEPCILAGCPEGGIVLDPFCGSGTTCYVAKEFKRDYIGIDISPQYLEMAEKRTAQGVL